MLGTLKNNTKRADFRLGRVKKQPEFTEEELISSVCKESFFEFVKEFWDTIIPDKPEFNWHIEYLCQEIQRVMEKVFRGERKLHDVICNISPGSTKSTVFSIMLPAWAWTRMPHCRFICGSYALDLSMDLSRRCRDIVKSEKYKRCFPDIQIRDDQDAKGYFINTSSGDRFSCAVGGRVTGMHGHVVIVDDPINPEEAFSSAELLRANRWMSETLPGRKINKASAPTFLVMQRLAENDPTGERLTKRDAGKLFHICLPAEETENIFPPFLRARYTNGLMDPERFPWEVLKEQRANLLEYGYSAQYLQHPVPRGGLLFDVGKIHILPNPPKRFKSIVRYWDKAGTLAGGAYTVGLLMGQDIFNNFWVLDVIRVQLDSGRREKLIKTTAALDKEEYKRVTIGVEQEPGSGGKESAEATVRNLKGYHVKVYKVGKSDGDKEARADPYSSQVNSGNVYLVLADWNKDYIDELRFFPRGKYKDQCDSSSGAFNMLAHPKRMVGGLGVLRPKIEYQA